MLSHWETTLKTKKEAIAITSSHQGEITHLRYYELEALSDALANAPMLKNLQPETLVGVYASPSSAAWIVSILAVWKRGGAVLLLDSLDRKLTLSELEYRVHNTRCTHFICCDHLAPAAHLQFLQKHHYVQYAAAIESKISANNKTTQPYNPNHLAYVTYTSGSTGKSKAIAITHSGIVPFTRSCLSRFVNPETDKILQFSSLHFDPCWMEFFLLCSGVACVQWDRVNMSAEQLAAYMNAQNVTAVVWVPSFMSKFSEPGKTFVSLKKVLTTGEACYVSFLKTWSPFVQIYIGYGPSEVTIGCTIQRFTGEMELGESTEGMQIQLIDTGDGRQQIAISGQGLARGYLLDGTIQQQIARPDEINQFPKNQFTEIAGQRVFLTGDSAEFINGKYIFQGRLDDQVKILGKRIELIPIEAVIMEILSQKNPGIQVKIVPHTSQTNKCLGIYDELIGFVISSKQNFSLTESEIHSLINIDDKPSQWYQIINSERYIQNSEKFNKKQLQADFQQDHNDNFLRLVNRPEKIDAAPKPSLFRSQLLSIIRHCLDCYDISDMDLTNNYFTYLGGNSNTWEILMSKIDKNFGIAVFSRRQFQLMNFTILQLMDEACLQILFRQHALAEIKPHIPNTSFLFCCPPVTGDPIEFSKMTSIQELNLNVCGIRMPAIFSAKKIELNEIEISALEHYQERSLYLSMTQHAQHLAIAIRKKQVKGPYRICGYSWGGQLAYAVAQELQDQGCDIAWLGILDSAYPEFLGERLSAPGSKMLEELYNVVFKAIFRSFNMQLVENLPTQFQTLNPAEQLNALQSYIMAQFDTPMSIDLEKPCAIDQCRIFFHSIFYNLFATINYMPTHPIKVKRNNVTLFSTEKEENASYMTTLPKRWITHFDAEISTCHINANHIELLQNSEFNNALKIALTATNEMTSQNIDLAEHIQRTYAENKYISNHFHEPLPLDRGFIRLAIVKEEIQNKKTQENLLQNDQEEQENQTPSYTEQRLSCFEEIYGTKNPIDLKDLFTPEQQEQNATNQHHRIIVLGRAGIGKSTMCQAIAYQWATQDLWKARFKILIRISLRNLLEHSQDEMTICDAIYKQVIPVDHLGDKTLKKTQIEAALKLYKPSEILYLLDGLDELSGKSNRLIESLLSQENIILTSRPHGANTYLASPNAKPMDRKLENIGFLDEDISAYIQMFFSHQPEGKTYCESLLAFLNEHPAIWGIAHVPINLLLLCIAWMDNYDKVNMRHIQNIGLTDLYKGLLANMTRRYLIKSGLDQCQGIINAISLLAFEQMQDISLLIPVEKLDSYGPAKSEIVQFGCLTPTDRRGNAYYFLHLTLQDFFAALYITEKLKANDAEMKKYIALHKYHPRYEMIWWFISGLLSTRENKSVLNLFFELLESEPQDLNHLYHHLLMMRCLEECQLRATPQVRHQFFQKHRLLISPSNNERLLFESSLSNYFKLCPTLLSQPEIISIYEELLKKPQRAMIARRILLHQSRLPKSLFNLMIGYLESENPFEKASTLIFLNEQSFLPPEIVKKFPSLLRDPNSLVKEKTIDCIRKLQRIDFTLAESFISLFNNNILSPEHLKCLREKLSKQPELWQLILPLFQNPRTTVRVNAIACMKAFPPQAFHLAILLPLLNDPDWAVRRLAVDVVVQQPGFQLEMLEPLLNDPHEKIYKSVRAYILKQFKKQIPYRFLDRLLRFSHATVKHDIMLCLQCLPQLSHIELSLVMPLLCDSDDSVRAGASACMRKVKILPEEIINEIKPLLSHTQAKIRRTAVLCFSDVTQFDIIAPLLADPEPIVKSAVLKMLDMMSGLPATLQNHLKPLLNGADIDLRCAALDCLFKQPSVSTELVLSTYHDPDAKVRIKAILQMGRHVQHFPQFITSIKDALDDPDSSVRASAMNWIVHHPDTLNTLKIAISVLKKPDGDVRKYAMTFINQHYPGCQEVLLYLDSLLADPMIDVRATALVYLNNQTKLSTNNIKKFITAIADVNLKKAFLGDLSRKIVINPLLSKYLIRFVFSKQGRVLGHIGDHFVSSTIPFETLLLLIPHLSAPHHYSHNSIKILAKQPLSFEIFQKLAEAFFGQDVLSVDNFNQITLFLKDNIAQILDQKSISSIVTLFAQHKNQVTVELLKLLAYKALKLNIPIYSCTSTCIQIGELDKIEFDHVGEMNAFILKYQQALKTVCGFSFTEAAAPNPTSRILMSDDPAEVTSQDDDDKERCLVM